MERLQESRILGSSSRRCHPVPRASLCGEGPSHSGFGDRGTALFVTANSRESHVYGRWSEVAIFEVDSIPRDHRLVEQKAGRRTIPIDELIDRMLITALRLK